MARLEQYRAKRDFVISPEPAGAESAPGSGRFVVQRHRARRLHYDLRLDIGGVLVSWAVPKGPTLDPNARRLAVHVEDHPLEYLHFEGVIPATEYGGGDVIVWDRGSWRPARTDDPAAAVRDGELHFDLYGEKLAGRFVLIRSGQDGDREQWLLRHKNDEHAVAGWRPEDFPASVKSGRTNDDVAARPDAVWRSDAPADEAEQREPVRAGQTWDPPSNDELAALDALGSGGRWRLGGRELKLTNLDKVLFPGTEDEPPVTKREFIRYHAIIAPYLLPYLAGRPVNTHRYPDGVDKPGFWHKEVPSHAPDWLTTWRDPDADDDETQRYAVVDSVPALAWLANYAAIDLHPWTSRLPDVHQPTWALIDIDPGEKTGFDDVLVYGRLYRTALDFFGLAGAPKLTGQRGLQIWVPIRTGYSFDDTREWVHRLSRMVGKTVPERVSWEWEKRKRAGLIRLDYTQNAINKTLVAPFSARPAPAAPVSVPITWEELDDPELRPDRWTIRTVCDRLRTVGDPLAALIGTWQELPQL